MLLTLMYKYSTCEEFLDVRRGDRVTRSDAKIKFLVKKPKLSTYKKSPLYRGADLWNKLGEWYQKTESKLKFKNRIRRLLDLSVMNDNPSKDDVFRDEDSIAFSDEDTFSTVSDV